jgi:hypothetical protein
MEKEEAHPSEGWLTKCTRGLKSQVANAVHLKCEVANVAHRGVANEVHPPTWLGWLTWCALSG